MAVLFGPIDNEPIDCQVRLWENASVHVFVHPKHRKTCGLFDGTPMIVELAGRQFECTVVWGGEFYASGTPADVKPSHFGLDEHGDYDAVANVDWDAALPDQVFEALKRDPGLADVWRTQTCSVIRDWLNVIARARKASSRMERELQLIGKLRTLAASEK